MKKLLVLLSIILLIQCKTAGQQPQSEIPQVTVARYHREIAGLKNASQQMVYELLFSEPLSEYFQVANFYINEKEKKIVSDPSGKISLHESDSSFAENDAIMKYKVRIRYNSKFYELEGTFQKKNTMHRP
ncbi:hypothetical protein J2X31_002856 [Flavobacterium arsenatis]|uniref:Lipoprotein n=1 Tax=Flavobacterium arsenatis TaxID=1484332 RepID=A0ABU1TSH0_9FLAO|nr:hypothetical protein [Flavobacterium arsenatis]MDR6968830.1 hypothetical protein [Flavobacterium arsenatis]